MITFITGLHIALCFFLILVVLLQTGKGADMGAAFGGASQTVFGATGAVSLLGKVTTVTAVLYMLTSMTLAWNSAQEQSGGGGLGGDQFDKERQAAEEGEETDGDETDGDETTGDEAAGTEASEDGSEAGAEGDDPDGGIGDYKSAYDEDPEGGSDPPAGGDAEAE